ncbi:hypothetical protein BS333_16990 [Vibrio azureus]|uniref:Knr4/Smi1-like domain-containing protein n=1 Tax=Vibrio azureus NBRC 104587 TaxID=1219077 RepID=U3ACM3_9VIBR|nr:SMI1/KNR4 family protein [Vibrio azureus]AUI88068.1 hypothetical protein BS333_16990 [Vibrio azureus]GAD77681.1 hypothetical protein VAZ01S_085_00280 [Vibrio azureus NBRC 104587]
MYEEQIIRIKQKLKKAYSVDSDFKVFGASSHKYCVKDPISNSKIEEFESTYRVTLPLCYKEFMLNVGNGGAGPYFGIYPLEYGVSLLAKKAGETLGNEVLISPGITDDEWEELTLKLDDVNLSDDVLDDLDAEFYSGILPIGSQGCTYYHALVLNGKYAGRVVNVDVALNMPILFCYENNFLDWYERWLDEVISGVLISDKAAWFGYTMGGDDIELLNRFDESDNYNAKFDVLLGLTKLHSASEESCERLKTIYLQSTGKLKRLSGELITKFNYQKSKSILEELIESDDVDCKTACQAIFWYQREYSYEWVPLLSKRIQFIKDPETFTFVTYILREAKCDFGDLLAPFCHNESEQIRATSYYSLGLLKSKSDYIDEFSRGLRDESSRVVRTALQAVSGIRNDKLEREYLGIIERFKNKNSMLVELDHNIKKLGYKTRSEFIKKYDVNYSPNNKLKGIVKRILDLFK